MCKNNGGFTMKKMIKRLALVMFAVFGLVSLASCGKYNFYKDWTEAGADLEKENIYEVLTLEEVQAKRDNKETFILVVGTSQSSTAVSSITMLQTQADYLGFEDAEGNPGTIYFVDSTDYIETSTVRSKLTKALGIKKISNSTTSDLIVVTYVKGNVELDTSDDDCEILEFLQSEYSGLSMEAVAYYLFRNFN
jgi:hypothetical protein